MTAFDIALYAAAIITVLLLRAERPTAEAIATPAPAAPAPAAPAPIVEEPQPEPQPITQPEAPAQPAAIAAPVVVATVKVAELPSLVEEVDPAEIDVVCFEAMTAVQLRKECQARAIRWRNAHGQSKHLSKKEMLAALA